MSTKTDVPSAEPAILMSRIYDAPREVVWKAMTEAKHVARWWGGAGFSNPVCEMDVRPGGLWRHVMRFPDGHELHMNFVFLEADKPQRLVWQDADHDTREPGRPSPVITVTLEDLGDRTQYRMVARFRSLAERDAALGFGFVKPIEGSNDRLAEYLKKL